MTCFCFNGRNVRWYAFSACPRLIIAVSVEVLCKRMETTHKSLCCSDIVSIKLGIEVETSFSSSGTTTAVGEPHQKMSASRHLVTWPFSWLPPRPHNGTNVTVSTWIIIKAEYLGADWLVFVSFKNSMSRYTYWTTGHVHLKVLKRSHSSSPLKVAVRFGCALKSLPKSQRCLAFGPVTHAFIFIDRLVLCYWL